MIKHDKYKPNWSEYGTSTALLPPKTCADGDVQGYAITQKYLCGLLKEPPVLSTIGKEEKVIAKATVTFADNVEMKMIFWSKREVMHLEKMISSYPVTILFVSIKLSEFRGIVNGNVNGPVYVVDIQISPIGKQLNLSENMCIAPKSRVFFIC